MHGPTTSEPERTIRAEIDERGSIGFDRFMELALYGPGGFYENPPIGTEPGAAFATSPHVHEVFASLLASGIRELHGLLGAPDPLSVVEIGAGDGTLAAGLIAELEDLPVRLTTVERSSGARTALAARGLEASAVLPGLEGVVVANELLDNLPFRLVRGTIDGPREVRVTVEGKAFAAQIAPAGEDLTEFVPRELEPGEETSVPTGALAFVDELAVRLRRGYAVLIDYGTVAGAPVTTSVHGYRGHRVVEDVLAAPGSADITAGVDLDAVARRAEQHGLRALGTPTQRAVLEALGFERWTRHQLALQGALLDRRDGLEAVRTWSGRSRASLLVDPSALGRLRWLVLAADGDGAPLPLPGWVEPSGNQLPLEG